MTTLNNISIILAAIETPPSKYSSADDIFPWKAYAFAILMYVSTKGMRSSGLELMTLVSKSLIFKTHSKALTRFTMLNYTFP